MILWAEPGERVGNEDDDFKDEVPKETTCQLSSFSASCLALFTPH